MPANTFLQTFLQVQAAKVLIHKYNTQLATTLEGRTELLQQLLGSIDAADPPFIEPPFYCDYGYNIHMDSGSYANFGFTVLDACRVDIGKRVLIGPNVQVRQALVRWLLYVAS
jgi:acetyltransferase-like isoleucine patch superfamily enzyme